MKKYLSLFLITIIITSSIAGFASSNKYADYGDTSCSIGLSYYHTIMSWVDEISRAEDDIEDIIDSQKDIYSDLERIATYDGSLHDLLSAVEAVNSADPVQATAYLFSISIAAGDEFDYLIGQESDNSLRAEYGDLQDRMYRTQEDLEDLEDDLKMIDRQIDYWCDKASDHYSQHDCNYAGGL